MFVLVALLENDGTCGHSSRPCGMFMLRIGDGRADEAAGRAASSRNASLVQDKNSTARPEDVAL